MAIVIFRGEDPTLTITVKSDGTTGFNLTGATMETRFLKKGDKTELILGNGVHTLDADQSANPGKFTLALNSTDTESLKLGKPLKIIISVTISSKVTKFEVSDLEVKPGNTLKAE